MPLHEQPGDSGKPSGILQTQHPGPIKSSALLPVRRYANRSTTIYHYHSNVLIERGSAGLRRAEITTLDLSDLCYIAIRGKMCIWIWKKRDDSGLCEYDNRSLRLTTITRTFSLSEAVRAVGADLRPFRFAVVASSN